MQLTARCTWLRRPLTVFVAMSLLLISLFPVSLQAQETGKSDTTKKERPKEIAKPLVVLNIASINRLLDNASFLFKQVERPEIMDFIGAGLANLRDFKGLDRDKSGGVMIFLAEGLLPQPVPVAYIPVSDIKELTQTLAPTPLKLQPSPDAEDRYELIPRNGQKLYVRLVKDYALISQTPENLEREYINPGEFTDSLTSRYDIALSANLKTTPEAVKILLLNVLRTSTQAGMQQRDMEAEGAYRLRKAQAEGNLHFFESLLKEGEEFTLGMKLEKETNKGLLDVIIRAKQDTGFAKELMGELKPSYFTGAIDSTVPLSLSISGKLDKFQQKQYHEFIAITELEANRGFAKLPATAKRDEIPQLEGIKSLMQSLTATVDEGHLDGFVQIHGDPEKNFTVLGGIRVLEGRKFGEGLQDILGRLKNETAPFEVELSATSYNDSVFHRLTPKKLGKEEERIYGERSAVYVGTDNNALWFAFGAEDAMPKLRAAIDRVEASKAHAPKVDDLKPIQFVMNMSQWVKLNSRREKPGQFNQLAQQAFNQAGNDVLRVNAQPIENGFRLRVQVENGFLRLIGLGIAKQIDGRQEL